MKSYKASIIVIGSVLAATLACNAPGGETEPATAEVIIVEQTVIVEADPTITPLVESDQVPSDTPTEIPPLTEEDTGENGSEGENPPPPEAPEPNASFEGLHFYLDPSLSTTWLAEIIPPPDIPAGAPDAFFLPTHYLFDFDNFVVESEFLKPQMYIIPTVGFETVNQFAQGKVQELTGMLDNPPRDYPEEFPVIPIQHGVQIIHAHIDLIQFQNGSGYRFITQFQQAPGPINNQELLYTFQGLTDDRKYYVALIVPITHRSLSDDYTEIPGGDIDAFIQNLETYMQVMEENLNAESPDSYVPSITTLDMLIQSLWIDR